MLEAIPPIQEKMIIFIFLDESVVPVHSVKSITIYIYIYIYISKVCNEIQCYEDIYVCSSHLILFTLDTVQNLGEGYFLLIQPL